MLVSERIGGGAEMPQTPRRQWPKVWLVGFVLSFLMLAALSDFAHLVQFAWDSASVDGRVTAIEPENHDATRVLYVVNERDYEMVSSFKPRTEQGPAVFEVGQTVRIYYLRSMPENAALQPPAELVGSALFQATLLASLAASYIAYLVNNFPRRGTAPVA